MDLIDVRVYARVEPSASADLGVLEQRHGGRSPLRIAGSAGADRRIADRCPLGQSDAMDNEPDGFEQSAQIVEAFSEGETDPRVLDLLSEITQAIRAKVVND